MLLLPATGWRREDKCQQNEHAGDDRHDDREDEIARMDVKTELVGEGKPDNGDDADETQQDSAPTVKKSTSQ